MTKTKIKLITEKWNYECGDGCCSEWDTSLTCENLGTGSSNKITDNLSYYDTSALLTLVLETIFPNLSINIQTVWIPELDTEQINTFTSQFSRYDLEVPYGDEVFYPLSAMLFENTFNIIEYIIQTTNRNQDYIALVFDSEYVYSSELSNTEEKTELDTVVEILKYLEIEVEINEGEWVVK